MNEFHQDYNFEYQYPPQPPQYSQQQMQQYYYLQKQREDKAVKSLTIAWIVCVASVFVFWHITPLIVDLLEASDALAEVLFFILGVVVVAQHILAIVGKIKYPQNKRMNNIFIGDMILLAALLIIVLVLVALGLICDAMCGDCG